MNASPIEGGERAAEEPERDAAPAEFRELGLSETTLQALDGVGYESPSPIQAATIPRLLAGSDLLGQAQTGTGKTAAFALPILDRIDLERRQPQAIVLTPTRELAIQVAEAFQRYAHGRAGFHVLPIYGGQAYPLQLRPLQRGVHVVVGTPGRVIDHLERGSLDLSSVRHFVLDEADEMLNMGFVDDVDTILARAPEERQIVLFSATMPPRIQELAETYMRDPEVVRMESRIQVAETVRQRFLIVKGNLKLDALTRILEAEPFDALLVFVRTKNDTVELSEKLEARGHACAPLSGDVPQKMREQTIERLKNGKLDIIVATDVAARGLDVSRISHVVNYDMPTGIEPYTHRIGRTGRAGRSGDAILFVKPQERRLLHAIRNATGRELEAYSVPSNDEVNASRVERFKQRIRDAARAERTDDERALYARLFEELSNEPGLEVEDVFAGLAELAQGDRALLFEEEGRQAGRPFERPERQDRPDRYGRPERGGRFEKREPFGKRERFEKRGQRDAGAPFDREQRGDRRDSGRPFERDRFQKRADRGFAPQQGERGPRRPEREPFEPRERTHPRERYEKRERFERNDQPERRFERNEQPERRFEPRDKGDRAASRKPRPTRSDEPGMIRYRVSVGYQHGLRPGNLVGAIANEGDISSEYIGRIEIYERFSTVDLPQGMPREVFDRLQQTRVRGQALRISELREDGPAPGGGGRPPFQRPRKPRGKP